MCCVVMYVQHNTKTYVYMWEEALKIQFQLHLHLINLWVKPLLSDFVGWEVHLSGVTAIKKNKKTKKEKKLF